MHFLLTALLACTGPDAAKDADTGEAAAGLGEYPPMPAVNNVTIRSGGVDTTFECGPENSGVSLTDLPDGYEDPQMFQLQCMSPDSGADLIHGFGLSAAGTFAAGASTTVAVEPERAAEDDTLIVSLAERGSGWSITLDGDGGTNFTGVVTLTALGEVGQSVAGTFQASWELVSMDTDGNGAAELVEQPSALSCAFDFTR